jgi:type III secretion system low calcium response chaperone LcrH/SycD
MIENEMDRISDLKELQQRILENAGLPVDILENDKLSLSEDCLQGLYAIAYNFYENGKYREAVHYFRVLSNIDAPTRKHWMGLGASLHMLKDYEKALAAYSIAALLDNQDPYVHIHAADCCFALEQKERGMKALDAAELVIKMNKNDQKLISQLALIRQAWSN